MMQRIYVVRGSMVPREPTIIEYITREYLYIGLYREIAIVTVFKKLTHYLLADWEVVSIPG